VTYASLFLLLLYIHTLIYYSKQLTSGILLTFFLSPVSFYCRLHQGPDMPRGHMNISAVAEEISQVVAYDLYSIYYVILLYMSVQTKLYLYR
jgi:hypothetical protein